MESEGQSAILPFTINFSNEKIADMQDRIRSAVIPDNVDDLDGATGLRVADFRSILEYWQTKYSWEKEKEALNKFPQFHTDIDGVDIHFIHQLSHHENATPIIMLHGWPSTPFEFRKIIPELTRQKRPEDAFHVVAPCLPGFAFSKTQPGLDFTRTADIFLQLMLRLGYDKYVVFGADLGNPIASVMVSKDAGQHCIGLHIQGSFAIPRLSIWSPWQSIKNLVSILYYSPYERLKLRSQLKVYANESAYNLENSTKPRTVGLALSQSPVAVGVWIADKFISWSDSTGVIIEDGIPEQESLQKFPDKLDISHKCLKYCPISLDDILTTITLFWLTESMPTSVLMYRNSFWLNTLALYKDTVVSEVPVALSDYICDVLWSPLSWARQQYQNLILHKFHDNGGHFASLEQPQAVVSDILEFKNRLCECRQKHC